MVAYNTTYYYGMAGGTGGEIVPTSFDISDMVMYSVDGTPFRLGSFKDITTSIDEGDPAGGQTVFTIAQPKEYTATVHYPHNIRKVLNKIMYGWKAKGPIRKRVMERLWRRKYKEGRYSGRV